MPRRANDERGNDVTAKSASKDDGWAYECPKCDGEMSVAGGAETAVRKHFRHRPGETCIDHPDVDETKLHRAGKQAIMTDLAAHGVATNIEAEVQLERSKPDILFTVDGDRVAVEIQVSRISAERIRKRTRDRTQDGVYTLWLLHDEVFGPAISKHGNKYVTYRATEYGLLSLFSDEAQAFLSYYNSEHGRPKVRELDPFDDGGGAFIRNERTIIDIDTFTTKRGFRLATAPSLVPEETGDDEQMRLFEA